MCHRSATTKIKQMDRGGSQGISVLALYPDDPSSNPTEAYSFSVKFVLEKNEKTKRGGGWPFKNQTNAKTDL